MPVPQHLCYNCFMEKQTPEGPCPFCGYDHAEHAAKYPMALRAGSILNGQYIVGRVLGQGGFGITYLAFDYQLKIKVAIKEYMPDGMATRLPDTTLVSVYTGEKQENFEYGAERFLDEARVLAKFLGNKNIAGVKSYFNENNTSYFVMDYIEGISFKTYIRNQGGKIDYTDVLRVLVPVLRALSVVHREGFIHRDVTPDNIYITKDGEIKLLDFGSARYSMGDKSKSLDVILKAGYAPKEQYMRRGKQGPYTDVYSVAACFYASITGYLPPEALERMEEDELVAPSLRGVRLPAYLEDAILKGLEVKAEDRYQNAEEFLTVIEEGQFCNPIEHDFPTSDIETALRLQAGQQPAASAQTYMPSLPVKEEAASDAIQGSSDAAAIAEGHSAPLSEQAYKQFAACNAAETAAIMPAEPRQHPFVSTLLGPILLGALVLFALIRIFMNGIYFPQMFLLQLLLAGAAVLTVREKGLDLSITALLAISEYWIRTVQSEQRVLVSLLLCISIGLLKGTLISRTKLHPLLVTGGVFAVLMGTGFLPSSAIMTSSILLMVLCCGVSIPLLTRKTSGEALFANPAKNRQLFAYIISSLMVFGGSILYSYAFQEGIVAYYDFTIFASHTLFIIFVAACLKSSPLFERRYMSLLVALGATIAWWGI